MMRNSILSKIIFLFWETLSKIIKCFLIISNKKNVVLRLIQWWCICVVGTCKSELKSLNEIKVNRYMSHLVFYFSVLLYVQSITLYVFGDILVLSLINLKLKEDVINSEIDFKFHPSIQGISDVSHEYIQSITLYFCRDIRMLSLINFKDVL